VHVLITVLTDWRHERLIQVMQRCTPVHVLAGMSPGEASDGARMNHVDERVVDVGQQSPVCGLRQRGAQLDCINTTDHC